MISIANNITEFFVANIPGVKAFALGGPPALLWATACLMLAGFLKKQRKWKTGYTRKVFHFLIFGSVSAIHLIWGSPGVCLFGGMTTLVIAYAVLRGSGYFMYEAMAREKDAPRRTHYIITPYLATLIGGLIGNIFFPQTVVFGYLVSGLGDAIAEPVGTRFGKHQYKAPAIHGVRAVRSIEGSLSVFLTAGTALLVYIGVSPSYILSWHTAFIVLIIAAVSTLVEAVSPHGWDNATMQITPAWLGMALL